MAAVANPYLEVGNVALPAIGRTFDAGQTELISGCGGLLGRSRRFGAVVLVTVPLAVLALNLAIVLVPAHVKNYGPGGGTGVLRVRRGNRARPDSSGVSPGVLVQCARVFGGVAHSYRVISVAISVRPVPPGTAPHIRARRRLLLAPAPGSGRRPAVLPSGSVYSAPARPVQPIKAGRRLDGSEDVVQRPRRGAALPPELGKTESLHARWTSKASTRCARGAPHRRYTTRTRKCRKAPGGAFDLR